MFEEELLKKRPLKLLLKLLFKVFKGLKAG